MNHDLIDKHLYINVDHCDWWIWVYEDFRQDMKDVGINVTRMYFSGFGSQGAGACFEGSLDNALLYLDKHHNGQYPMIRKLLEHGGSLNIMCEHSGHYCHENSVVFRASGGWLNQVIDCPTEFHTQIVSKMDDLLSDELNDFEVGVIEQWRTYMRDLYYKLEEEYDYLTSDEAVWEALVANDLTEEVE